MRKGFILLISGLSGSGKSTIAKLLKNHIDIYILEGDEVRDFFGGKLGFGEGARMESGRRLCFGAHLLSKCGVNVVITCTMGTPEIRERMKKLLDFKEIYMDTDIKYCIENDPKGIYKENMKLDKPNIRGLDLLFEPPKFPDLTLYSYIEKPEQSVKKLIKYLEGIGYI